MKILTSRDAASSLGISARRVCALAKKRNLGKKFGRIWLFTFEDIKKMKIRKLGRPNNRKINRMVKSGYRTRKN